MRGRFGRFTLLAVACSLLLSSVILVSAPQASGGGSSWLQTTRQDFANGTSWNVDVNSSPGDVTLPASPSAWIESSFNPGLRQSPPGSWDDSGLSSPVVLKEASSYRMWYAGDDSGSGSFRIGYAVSKDGVNWSRPTLGLIDYGGSTRNNIVLDLGAPGSADASAILPGTIVHDGNLYMLWYSCKGTKWAICYASSTDGLIWTRQSPGAVIEFGGLTEVMSPAVYKDALGFHMWVARSDDGVIYRPMLADSSDGISWAFSLPADPPTFWPTGGWNDSGILPGTVLPTSNGLQMWYSGIHAGSQSIGYASCTDCSAWTESPLNPVLEPGTGGTWDSASLSRPWVVDEGTRYRMWFAGSDGNRWSIGTAASAYGERIAPPRTNPVLSVGGLDSWDRGGVFRPSVVLKDGTYHMWYSGSTSPDGSTGFAIGHATSADGITWKKSKANPVLEGSGTGWDGSWVGFAWVVWSNVTNGFLMWYTGSDGSSMRIGLAASADGDHWQRDPANPVTFNSWQPWFNATDVRCPWVGTDFGRRVMYVGTKAGSTVSIAEANSTDGGRTWFVLETNTTVSPQPGTWEGASVSCPAFIGEDQQDRKLWYQGSTDTGIAAMGRIGFVTSNVTSLRLRRPWINVTFEGGRPWDLDGVGAPAVISAGSSITMWFQGTDGGTTSIGRTISRDAVAWHESFAEPVLYGEGVWSGPYGVGTPVVFHDDTLAPLSWIMFYSELVNTTWTMQWVRSADGRQWAVGGEVSFIGQSPAGWEIGGRKPLAIVKRGGTYHIWYAGMDGSGRWSIGHATAFYPESWTPSAGNPVIGPGQSPSWDSEGIGGAAVISPGLTNTFEMWYSGYDGSAWRIGFLHSGDGIHWSRIGADPVLSPSGGSVWDSDGVSNPSVLLENGMYHAFFSGFDGGIWSLGHAFSRNGVDWIKSRMNPILGGASLSRNHVDISSASVLQLGSTYRLFISDSGNSNSAIASLGAAYLSTGFLTSYRVDSGLAGPVWTSVGITKSVPPTSSATVSTRTGLPPFTGITWSPERDENTFRPVAGRDRYLQYRLSLVSMRGDEAPLVSAVGGEYEANLAPTATPLSPAEGSCSANSIPTFTWRYSDPHGDVQSSVEIEIALDQSFNDSSIILRMPVVTGATAFPSADEINDRSWYWRIRATDLHGLTGEWSAGVMSRTDLAPPRTRVEVLGQRAGIYISASTRLQLNASDDNCGVRSTYYGVDNQPLQPYISPFTLSDGYHVVRYFSEDEAGNNENVTSQAFWVDSTAPETDLQIGESVQGGGVVYVRPQTMMQFTSSDNDSGVRLTEHGFDATGAWIAGTSAFFFGLSGPHTLNYRSIDFVGNVETGKSLQVFVDDSPPITSMSIQGPMTGSVPVLVTPNTSFVLNATDDGVGVDSVYYLLDNSQLPALYKGNLSVGTEGPHTLRYYAVDLLGNVETERFLRIQVDGQGPATTLIPLGPSYASATRMYVMPTTALTFASVDGGSGLQTIRYSLDGGAWHDYSSAFNVTSQGSHVLAFYGLDLLGNVETEKTVALFVDDAPPATQITLSGAQTAYEGQTYVDTSTSIELSSIDTGSGVFLIEYRVDGGTWSLYSHPITLSGSGPHILDVQATDNLGLKESPHSLKLVLDAEAPVAVAGPDVAVFAPATVTFDGSASTDDTAIVSYSWIAEWIGGVVLQAATGNMDFGTPGQYVLHLTVRDPLGRESNDTMIVKVLANPDSDGDSLPDIWEKQQFGNLTYGPNDDPNGDGSTLLDDYRSLPRDEGENGGSGGGDAPRDNSISDVVVLLLYSLVGVLAGTIVVQALKNRDLKRKLREIREEQEVSSEYEEDDDEDAGSP